jgi:hypothetical protein
VQEKVEVVKSTMKESIEQLLLNEEKMEKIEASSQQLNQQSSAFRAQSAQVSRQMWWRMWKMRLLLGGLVLSVLVILIVPFAVMGSRHKH